jgi:hypothetical protein
MGELPLLDDHLMHASAIDSFPGAEATRPVGRRMEPAFAPSLARQKIGCQVRSDHTPLKR